MKSIFWILVFCNGKVAVSPLQNYISTFLFLYLYEWFCPHCEHDANDCDNSFLVSPFVDFIQAFPVCPVQNTIDQNRNLAYNLLNYRNAIRYIWKANKTLRSNAICSDFSGNLSNLLLSLVFIQFKKVVGFHHKWIDRRNI